MARISKKLGAKRNPDITRCLRIKDDGTICGTILYASHNDNICHACRHHVAFNLERPRLAKLEDFLKQKGATNGRC